jgi:ABC-type sugar transport system ATPase subunit
MLLERFYDVHSGQVLVDGHDIRALDPTWLRQHIGYIAQQPALFSTSIRENIRYGCPNATEDEIITAARLANAHEFISQFPDGYSTIVGKSLTSGTLKRKGIGTNMVLFCNRRARCFIKWRSAAKKYGFLQLLHPVILIFTNKCFLNNMTTLLNFPSCHVRIDIQL